MSDFCTKVITGENLEKYISPTDSLKRRKTVDTILSLLRDDNPKVNIVFGLRRTGKTVAMRQAILDMTPEERSKTAFIMITRENNFGDLRIDLEKLRKSGFENIFVDEITFMENFIDASSLLSDYFSEMGMKLFLSGTDSLSFVFASYSELFDRCRKISTTWIPFFEYSNLKGTQDIDTYLQSCGVLSDFFMNDDTSGNTYIYTSIAENIQHSLEYYKDGLKFRSLYDLYNRDELTDAIVRFVQDKNHRFVEKVFNKAFKSSDISLTLNNLAKTKDKEIFESYMRIQKLLKKSDIQDITRSIMKKLKMKEKKIVLNKFHMQEMNKYFNLLDFIVECPQESYEKSNPEKRNLLQQQGIRYLHLKAVLDTLKRNEIFMSLQDIDREVFLQRLLNTAYGLMTEEVVLLDTFHILPKSVFTFELPNGEFDMIVRDEDENFCHVFEIKHSSEQDERQRIHLENPKNIAFLKKIYNNKCNFQKYVLYQGNQDTVGDISYINIKDYLMSLESVQNGQNYSTKMDEFKNNLSLNPC